jgi:hypothetical protein
LVVEAISRFRRRFQRASLIARENLIKIGVQGLTVLTCVSSGAVV